MKQRLILFDIDGTLISHVGPRRWEAQYEFGMEKAYGITQKHAYGSYNGSIERHMAWDVVQQHGIGREEFFTKFPDYVNAMQEHLDEWAQKGSVFQPIPEAMTLVSQIADKGEDILAILTGNAQRIGEWKLAHTGYKKYFSFGLYGEEADDRVALAKLVFEKAEKEFKKTFEPKEIVVIGDTVHDVRCGKAIGAVTIAVTTGMHQNYDALVAEKPDFLVGSLMDAAILDFFGLS